jgi:ATP/maltotriose-dependent transcriptional regulator MalT
MGVVDDLARAREAYERREWVAAYDSLSDVETSALDADDFARLSVTAYLLGRRNDCVQAMQRAYRVHLDRGETLAAVRCGYWLGMVLLMGGEAAVGAGWVGRCRRLLDDVEGDVVERGYLLALEMFRNIFGGEPQRAYELAQQVTDYGRRFGDADLLANGLNAQGRMLIYTGHVPEGLALLDEAMVGVSTGDVSPIVAGEIYCSLIEACQEVSDYARAAQWTSLLTAWIDEQPGLVTFTGQSAVHRGQIMRVRGAFAAAVEEFELATERYVAAGTLAPAGLAMSECGDVLRTVGDLEAAEAAYERAVGFGYDAQPGLALLWLARGRGDAAGGAVRRLLAEPGDPVGRSRLLPGAVEVLLGVGALDEADAAVDELAGIATAFDSIAVDAMAAQARGSVLVARGDAGAAVPVLRRALTAWRDLDVPYEAARARVLMGRAMRELGDGDSAAGELAAALRTFHQLGAVPAEREVAALLVPVLPAGLTEREVEVLRLVATGSSNPEIATALVLSEKTVARHLSNIFTKLDVRTRTAAAAFAFENRLV